VTKRVLIVVSSYRPTIIADMHRARLLAQELPACGWEVEVLVPDATYQRPETLEPRADLFFAADTPVHDVPAWMPGLFRSLGMGSISWRAMWPMYKQGQKLLASRRFDIVYFTTTSFGLFCLGRVWHRQLGVPYILDFHDPWYRSLFKYVTTTKRWKWHLSRWLAKRMEAFAIADAAAIVSVSASFLNDLLARYAASGAPWLSPRRHEVIPFAATERDLRLVATQPTATQAIGTQPTGTLTNLNDGLLHVVYVGAGGGIMADSLQALCQAIHHLRGSEPELVNRLRIHLYGTESSWREGDIKVLAELARREGAGDLVKESPTRKTYLESIQLAQAADGLLVLGVDDAGYMPSKLFAYLLLGKPVIASFHGASPAATFLEQKIDLVELIRFGEPGASSIEEAAAALKRFLLDMSAGAQRDRAGLLDGQLAPAMARQHAELFEQVLAPEASPPASLAELSLR
jgi:glycosyltransferase involved in cell wall biosynthesis